MATPKLNYPNIVNEIERFLAKQRSESASFLAWYLANYYRLDDLEAVDSICDQSGDRGIDGIYVNEANGTIDIFQSKISQNGAALGDKLLREFQGSLAQFASVAALDALFQSAGNAAVVSLAKRLDLRTRITQYPVRGVFLANTELDANGAGFLGSAPDIIFVGKKSLEGTYVSDSNTGYVEGKSAFSLAGIPASQYIVDKDTKAVIAPILAKELIKLSGIENQTLFAWNVRGPLGNTQVNRDIVRSLQDKGLHKLFPLFHNGITLIAESVSVDKDSIEATNYSVVNGCQSLTALFRHSKDLTDDLRLLVRFVQVPRASDLYDLITTNSNNQNGVKARDFKSNDPIQVRLQNEFRRNFKDQYEYEIKRGESLQGGQRISNEEAGLLLLAFDIKEPWATHRKYQLFDEKYSDVYARPQVNAHRIVLLFILEQLIDRALAGLNNQAVARYALTRFLMLFILRLIFESDAPTGHELIANPAKFVGDDKRNALFVSAIEKLIKDVVVDLDFETKDLKEDFDYRGALRDKEWVENTAKQIAASRQKDVQRGKASTLTDLFKAAGVLT